MEEVPCGVISSLAWAREVPMSITEVGTHWEITPVLARRRSVIGYLRATIVILECCDFQW
jgi:hypothetical protein